MSDPQLQLGSSFLVGEWLADGDAISVRRGSTEHALEPRAFQVLRYLAERPGRLITIDELMDGCWQNVIVTPNTVARIIAQLRKALDDDARQPRYLDTVARKGYRLIADVRRPATRKRVRTVAAVVVLGAALIAAAATLWVSGNDPGPTVAVFRFENFTGAEDLEYIADGVSEEIINSLVAVAGLSVVSRSASFRYDAEKGDPIDFATSLDVDYFVEGSVRKNGQRLRFTAQLIDVSTGQHLWSDNFEVEQQDLFSGQDAISRGVAQVLGAESGLAAELGDVPESRAPVPDAYDLYLRGRRTWHLRGKEPFELAVNYFAEAVKVDPEFARGWAALASAYLTWPSYSSRGFATMRDAEAAANRALVLDPALAEPYGVLATFERFQGNWTRADELHRESIRRNDQNPTAHFWYSDFLAGVGRFNESFGHLRIAMALDPLYAPSHADVAWAHLFWGDPEVAHAEFVSVWQGGFQGIEGWVGNYWSLVNRGRIDEARAWLERAPVGRSEASIEERFLDVIDGTTEDLALVADLLANREGLDHRGIIQMTAMLGEFEVTSEYIRGRLRQGRRVETWILWGPVHELRNAPQFPGLLDELGLLAFWDERGWGDVCRRDGRQIVCDGRDIDLTLLEE